MKEEVPGAEEVISYNMPALKFHGIILYYAVHKNHFGLYPYPSVVKKFKKELSKYSGTSKGTIRFPLNKALPYGLIREIVKFRAKENMKRYKNKK